jgi:hypothetical protein
MPTSRRPLPDPAARPGIRLWLVVAILAVLAGLAAAIWLLWPREEKVAAVTALQQRLLAAGGPPRRADVDEQAEAARRQLVERFDAAVEAHAKARGRQLPTFR